MATRVGFSVGQVQGSLVSSLATAARTTTTGNMHVICIGWQDSGSGTITSITDTGGNSYSPLTAQVHGSGALATQIWYAKNITGAVNNQVTVNWGSPNPAYVDIVAIEYSGVDTTAPADKETGATGSSANPASGSTATTTQANELLIACIGSYNFQDFTGTWSNSFTPFAPAGTSNLLGVAERFVSSTGAYSTGYTFGGSDDWCAAIATFKDAGGTAINTGRSDETDAAVARALAGYGVSIETDAAVAVSVSKSTSAGRADETDTVFAQLITKAISTARADETDTALAPSFVSQLTTGRADEADSAFSLALAKVMSAGRSDEADTALTVGIVPNISTGRSDESDAALQLALAKTISTGRSDESDFALARQLLGVGIANESDLSLSLSFASAMATGRADETDSAFSIVLTKVLNGPGLGVETDTALSPGFAAFFGAGRADETDQAFGSSLSKSLTVSVSSETDSAVKLDLNREFATVGRANETDVALAPSVFSKQFVVTEVSVEFDAALGPGWIVAGGGGADIYQRNRIRGLRVP